MREYRFDMSIGRKNAAGESIIMSEVSVPMEYCNTLTWRNIGPHRGGRVVSVAADPVDPLVFYFGSAGGVWKTWDGGEYWENISDGYFKTSAVGALAISESDRNVLYAGMGESCLAVPRFHWTSQADGVYKSTDAGKTWNNVGLIDTRHISRIRVHPTNPDIVYVAVLGHLEEPHHEKGVYLSRDGGGHWEKILYRCDTAGACDLSMDSNNPRILYAALWDAKRSYWESHSVGADTSIYKSSDGGNNWIELTDSPGLPVGLKGRIGITVSPARSDRVWALIEAKNGGLFRSDDAGMTWNTVSNNPDLTRRPHYYSHVFAHPKDPERVYVMSGNAWKSTDGGYTFKQMVTPHKDNHELWIDPKDPKRMIQSHDGGANVSFNAGDSWSSIYNQSTAEFYHLAVDEEFPYKVYGTQQDNTAICVPSRSHKGAIIGSDVYPVGSAESGHIAVRPDNSNIVYAGAIGSHQGAGAVLIRYDHHTGQVRIITIWPDLAGWKAKDRKYRFQWDFPIVISPHDPDILYAAGNMVFRSTDEGTSWIAISPDLTRNDLKPMENAGNSETTIFPHDVCTILSFAESPMQKGLFWVGTDDGIVQISKDHGKNWHDVTPKSMPEWSLVCKVEPSNHDPARAYISATRYKDGDYRPYLWKTEDFGNSWQEINDGISDVDFTRVVKEDIEVTGLLYAGTEGGTYVSFDDGNTWQSLKLNMPPVPIHDMVVKNDNLIVATYGRGFWILDDLGPLRQIDDNVLDSSVYLFKPSPYFRLLDEPSWRPDEKPVVGEKNYFISILGSPMTFREILTSDGRVERKFLNAGTNPPSGVIITYYLSDIPIGEISLSFQDADGSLITKFSNTSIDNANLRPLTTNLGSNQFVWDTRYPGSKLIAGDKALERVRTAPLAPPGTYSVILDTSDITLSQTFEIIKDPRVSSSQDELEQQFKLIKDVRDKVTEINEAVMKLRILRTQISKWGNRSKTPNNALDNASKSLFEKLGKIEQSMIQKASTGISKNFSSREGFFADALNIRMADLISTIEAADGSPTTQTYQVFDYVSKLADDKMSELDQIEKEDVPAFIELIHELEIPFIGEG